MAKNAAKQVPVKPHVKNKYQDVLEHTWTPEEANQFLKTVKEKADPQQLAFYALALDTGARKAELCGLQWKDVDLEQGTVFIHQQLKRPSPNPEFKPPKNGRTRLIHIANDTVNLLKRHKAIQNEIKMAQRDIYHDHGLVFAKDGTKTKHDLKVLGDPIQMNNLGEREFNGLIEVAKVRRIKFHGLRHTCATLLVNDDSPENTRVIQERLSHHDLQRRAAKKNRPKNLWQDGLMKKRVQMITHDCHRLRFFIGCKWVANIYGNAH